MINLNKKENLRKFKRALAYKFFFRKKKLQKIKSLWIKNISNNLFNFNYSLFIYKLKQKKILINRKNLNFLNLQLKFIELFSYKFYKYEKL